MIKFSLQKVTDVVEPQNGERPDVLFLVASSFEPRSVRAANLLKEGSSRYSVIFQYEDTLDSTVGIFNYNGLKKQLQKSGIEPPDNLLCKFSEPYSALQQLDLWFENHPAIPEKLVVTIDITCFTKLHLLLLLEYIESRFPQCRIRILYTEPLSYATAFGRSLSYGIRDVIYLPLNSGNSVGERSALIIFLGHEEVRVERIIEEIEPDETILILGQPGFSPEMSWMSEKKNRYLINRAKYNPQFRLAYCSTRNFREVAGLVHSLILNLRDKRDFGTFYVAPLGTKLQALSLHYVRHLLPHTRMILGYSIPKRYEKSLYSQGFGPTYSAHLTPIQALPTSEIVETEGVYSLKD